MFSEFCPSLKQAPATNTLSSNCLNSDKVVSSWNQSLITTDLLQELLYAYYSSALSTFTSLNVHTHPLHCHTTASKCWRLLLESPCQITEVHTSCQTWSQGKASVICWSDSSYLHVYSVNWIWSSFLKIQSGQELWYLVLQLIQQMCQMLQVSQRFQKECCAQV